ncbi:MAG: hypothetical protein RL559_1553 [Pseudomonadota bacterium]|jgi:tripartite-type tricarboxylate transporter receptor subunit TctC
MRTFNAWIVLAALWSWACSAGAQDYPSKPVRLVVAYPAGGGVDFVARTLSQKLTESLGQPVMVENKAGASGAIGADNVAKAAPDGHTLLLASPAEVLVGPLAGQKTPYQADKAFVPVVLVGETPLAVVGHPSLAASQLSALIAQFKGARSNLSYGTPGSGSSMHFAGEALNLAAQLDLQHLPYRGAAPAVNDVLGNQIPLAIVGLPPVVAHAKSGRLKVLAVTTEKRSRALPEVPAVAELPGLSDFRFSNWMLLMAPARTPAALVDKLASEVARLLQDKDTQQRLQDAGVEPMGLRGVAVQEFLQQERLRYAKVAQQRAVQFSE